MSVICESCLICECDMTHSYVWHDSFTLRVAIDVCYMRVMSHMWMRHDSFIRVTWLICIACSNWYLLYASHVSYINAPRHMYILTFIHMRDTYECVMSYVCTDGLCRTHKYFVTSCVCNSRVTRADSPCHTRRCLVQVCIYVWHTCCANVHLCVKQF